jgi:murein DD-endopeptidase MepM/ murein hydrolase activator NlpD
MRGARWVVCLALAGGSAFAAPAREWLSAAASAPGADAHVPEDLAEEAQALRDQLDALKRESAERQALTVARGRAYVRLARAGLMPLTNGFDALAAHASRLERLRRALGRDLARERQVTARRLEMARALQELDELNPADRQAMVRARTAVLAAEERDQAFQRAFQSDWNPSPATAVYGASVAQSYQPPAAGGFAAQRGRLPFPLAGRSEIQKVRSPSGSGKALLMLSTSGAMVRAVYPGRVAFADEYPNLGNTVIVDHGGHYYTVSAHLQRIAVEVGEELSAGQRIGTVGLYEKKPALLFEVRDGKSTIDTPEWFGI